MDLCNSVGFFAHLHVCLSVCGDVIIVLFVCLSCCLFLLLFLLGGCVYLLFHLSGDQLEIRPVVSRSFEGSGVGQGYHLTLFAAHIKILKGMFRLIVP